MTVVSAAPHEGSGDYSVAATAPAYGDGALTTKVTAPASTTTTGRSHGTGADPGLGHRGRIDAVAVTEATAGKYNPGVVLVARTASSWRPRRSLRTWDRGPAAPLGEWLAGRDITALYYLSVRAWNSSDPSGTLTRQWYPTAVDLRSSASGSMALTIN